MFRAFTAQVRRRLLRGAGGIAIACLAPAAGALAQAGQAQVFEIVEADVRAFPEGAPAVQRHVALRDRWDQDFPGVGGRATYTIQLPPAAAGSEPEALLFERVGNQATMRVNGVVVEQFGTASDTRFDAGKAVHLVVLPEGVMHASGANVLTVDLQAQPMRMAGLWPVHVGPLSAVRPLHARMRLLDDELPVAYAASMLLMGGLAAGLWWLQRDRLYGYFSLAALFGVFRHLDHAWAAVPVPWSIWGGVLAVAAGIHLGLIAHFSILILRPATLRESRAINGVIGTVAVLATLAFGCLWPVLWTMALVLLELLGLACLSVVLAEAVRHRRPMAWTVFGALTLLVAAGLHDIVLVRMGWLGGGSIGLTPHAMFLLICLLAALVAARYSRTVADYRTLHEHLAERIAEREEQLRGAFESLRVQQQDRAVQAERERMMREIPDGIGSQLVGMLNMLDHDPPDRAVLERELRLALDEMRMAVDSLQPVDCDLTVVLATLRYRLQPRLEAARLAVDWDVSGLPPISGLSPHAILQLQRILLEAFTNVLKHARATRVALHAHWREGSAPGVVIRVTDNGVGFLAGDSPVGHGKGLANMRARALAIGAGLVVEAPAAGGTSLVIDWPAVVPAPTRAGEDGAPPVAEAGAVAPFPLAAS